MVTKTSESPVLCPFEKYYLLEEPSKNRTCTNLQRARKCWKFLLTLYNVDAVLNAAFCPEDAVSKGRPRTGLIYVLALFSSFLENLVIKVKIEDKMNRAGRKLHIWEVLKNELHPKYQEARDI